MNISKAPLPFQGQKRMFLNQYRQALEELRHNTVFIDLFGGSGLLSHVTKRTLPKATVVWNDFDNYLARMERVDETNELLSKIRKIVEESEVEYLERIPDTYVVKIKQVLTKTKYIDFISIGRTFNFAGQVIKNINDVNEKGSFNRVPQSNYYIPENYLRGVSRVRKDYKDLLLQYRQQEGVVFIADPPYPNTDTKSYTEDWSTEDHKELMDLLDGLTFIYFTSDKNNIIDLDAITERGGGIS